MFNYKSKWLVPAMVFLAGVVMSSGASAALDLKSYKLGKTSPQVRAEVESYVNGLRDGIVLFDIHRNAFDHIGSKFCVEGRKLNGERTIAILDREIAEPSSGKSYPDDIPIVFVLIRALERFASCP
jgi:hypothetical protein